MNHLSSRCDSSDFHRLVHGQHALVVTLLSEHFHQLSSRVSKDRRTRRCIKKDIMKTGRVEDIEWSAYNLCMTSKECIGLIRVKLKDIMNSMIEIKLCTCLKQ